MAEKLKNRHTKKQFHCLTSLDSLLWSSTKTAQLTGLASFFFISLQTEPHKIPELYKSQQIFRSESWFQKKQLGYNWELSSLMSCQSSRSHFRRLQPSSGRNRLRACGPNHKSQEFSCPAITVDGWSQPALSHGIWKKMRKKTNLPRPSKTYI